MEETNGLPSATLNLLQSDGASAISITSIAMNKDSSGLLATGDTNGALNVWVLPEWLSKEKRGDIPALRSLHR